MTDLQQVLDRATEHLASPDLAGRALASAHRRRVRRAAAGALAAVVLLGGAATWAVQDRVPRADVVKTPLPTPSPTRSTGADQLETDDLDVVLELPTPPRIEESVVQPMWDPATAADLPLNDVGLPASLAPPAGAPDLAGVPAAVALVQDSSTASVADKDGRWWRVPLPEEALAIGEWRTEAARLSTDGTWLALPGRTALWALELSDPRWRRIDYPRGFLRSRMFPLLVPMRGSQVVLGRDREWLVDLAAASFEELPNPLRTTAWGEGVLVSVGGSSWGMNLLSWGTVGGEQHSFRTDYLQAFTGAAVSADSLAGVRGVGTYGVPRALVDRTGLVALRLDDLSTRAYLPLKDPGFAMTDGGLMAVEGWLDRDTVLASAGMVGPSTHGDRTLFTWDVDSGELRRVSTLPQSLTFDVAPELLGD